ncbi:MAG: nucleotide exchange factor GrpE [Actinomycetota bacterium]|nr:nucleotide exchange factor GrpE [Actinomycetota bacterium]
MTASSEGSHGDPQLEDATLEEGEEPELGPQEPAAQSSPQEHGAQVARDLDELSARAEKADEYLELAQRTKADFENYRKRAARETAAAQERGVAKLARELLPAVDNLDRALEAVQAQAQAGEEASDSVSSGIKLVHADVVAALSRAGIQRYSPQGEAFDPQHHEAVAQHPVEGAQPGTVVEVYQRGYRIGDSVLRPARVVVAQ